MAKLNTLDPQKITPFAETNFRSQQRRFGIKLDDRRRHMYVIGKTGMGKSTLLENMIISDIREGHGLAVVDPHGDLVEKIIDFIPSWRINDVVYFNPADIDYPIAFNALEAVDTTHRHLVASGLVGVFKKIWADSWGPRLEYVLRNTILSLLEYPGSTILGITRLLVDNKYRKKVVSKINDPILISFWQEEYGAYSQQFKVDAISPIQNKVGQFLSSSIIRNIVGQTKSSIDMRDVMDSGKILLMNLAKGRIGEDNSKLLGAMMITKLQLAAMSRVDIPEEDRQDFFLYVDEFQNFATESFANILSEARKYHLDLIIAHQYIEQLDEIVRAAVFGNVGTLACYRVGAADAEFLEKEFDPTFTPTDLVNLAKYEMYLKLMINGMASEPFSARGLPPIQTQATDGHRDKIIQVSRERYATPRSVVEAKIIKWAGLAGSEGEGDRSENDRNNIADRPPRRPVNDTDRSPRRSMNESSRSVRQPMVGANRSPHQSRPDSSSSQQPSAAPVVSTNQSTPSPSSLRINLADALIKPPEPEQSKTETIPEPESAISLREAMKQPPVAFKNPRRDNPGAHRADRQRGQPGNNQRPRPPKSNRSDRQNSSNQAAPTSPQRPAEDRRPLSHHHTIPNRPASSAQPSQVEPSDRHKLQPGQVVKL
ncbi:MAG: type IV secretion system DNA-binding domain-containing protein [Patescibacteria group bacterium]|jgi:hypothetical protein